MNSLRQSNPNILEKDLVQVASVVQAVTTEGGLFAGVSPLALAKNVNISENGVDFSVGASIGKKWIQQANKRIQTEEGIGAGVSLSRN